MGTRKISPYRGLRNCESGIRTNQNFTLRCLSNLNNLISSMLLFSFSLFLFFGPDKRDTFILGSRKRMAERASRRYEMGLSWP